MTESTHSPTPEPFPVLPILRLVKGRKVFLLNYVIIHSYVHYENLIDGIIHLLQ